MFLRVVLGIALIGSGGSRLAAWADEAFVELPEAEVIDRIHGGLLGQLLGNLNGLPHEFKYIREPGNVEQYQPGLPDGARTDDDTDIEWVYLIEMERGGALFVDYTRIGTLWQDHISDRIWMSNRFARTLMEIGIHPPDTGSPALNPWAEFNISGQFVCESFGLAAPALPQTAARMGVHYLRVTVDDEPLQVTQLLTTMIAAAFVTSDLNQLLDVGLAAVDPRSTIRLVVADVRRWHREHPADWRATRQAIHEKYTRHGGTLRDHNGYELNLACTIAALLHGNGDFADTLRLAFNLGYDCDNNAASCGTILGVWRGAAWMRQQGWPIQDRYRNTSRPGLPDDETITRFADRIVAVARLAVRDAGGTTVPRHGQSYFRLPRQAAQNVRPLAGLAALQRDLRAAHAAALPVWIGSDDALERARGAYLAIALDQAVTLRQADAARWSRAVEALAGQQALVREIFRTQPPLGPALQERARSAGLMPPPKS